MRTDDEIIERVRSIKDRDFFGFEIGDLVSCLPFDKAKEFLNADAKEEDWGEVYAHDRESMLKQMLDYMPFAWKKANNGRGLSAGRSMAHYNAWIWLAGDDLGDMSDYQFYGKDNLVKICDHYGWDAKQWDDGVREN